VPDDDSAADDGPFGPLLPPDDRLWRHPSELSWDAPRPVEPQRPLRPWAVALVSGVTGAVLAVGLAALVGALDGDVPERVVERVPVENELGAFARLGVPDGVPAVADRVGPSVVRLDVAADGSTLTGSGVVFDDGTVVTSAHVVADATTVTLVLADGTALPATVVGTDRLTDVAVVAVADQHVSAVRWVPAVLGTATDLEVGQPAIAVGSPLGLTGEPSVTVGVVSGLHRRVDADGVVLHDMIQTDAPVARGSSGGALSDAAGVVVGITTALAGTEPGLDGLAFATPIDVARRVAEDLLADGDVERPWLGIEGADAGRTLASSDGGVDVVTVVPAAPADAAGIEAGDVIVAFDGQRVRSMSELVVALRRRAPGDVVPVHVQRGEHVVSLEVLLGERP
jgi:putative serine protease PepD